MALSTLAGILMTLLLLLTSFSTAFAASTPSGLGQDEALDRAGVSVVRLLVSYTAPGATVPALQCTGLGVLVASWSSQNTPAEQNNWVLTDGKLVNPEGGAACLTPSQKTLQASVQLFFSSFYSGQGSPLGEPSIEITSTTTHCEKNPCQDGLVLFSFHTDSAHTQPALGLSNDTTQQQVLNLTNVNGLITINAVAPPNPTGDLRIANAYKQAIQQVLTPNLASLNQADEPWLPIVNSHGQLVGLHTDGGTTINATEISTFLATVDALKTIPVNSLRQDWESGLTAYYQTHNYTAAQQKFQAAFQQNSQFLGAQKLSQLAKAAATKNNGSKGSAGAPVPTQPYSISLLDHSISLFWLLVPALVVIALVLVVGSLLFARSKARRRKVLEAELAEAERKSEIDAPLIAQREAAQRQEWAQPNVPLGVGVANPPSAPAASYQAAPELSCPRCGRPIPRNANYCSNCRLLLSPSESGLHLRVADVLSHAPGAVPVPANMAANAMAEQPTMEITASAASNGTNTSDQTHPYSLQQLAGPRLGFAVATRSDPGIKRKYKPNEDSLLVARGTWTLDDVPFPVGLFVVADGMGGHANGQDASRRAIQTIVDYLAPKIANAEGLLADTIPHLLVEAVQQANQAVHQNNVELHADMGTTVTAAMIIGSTVFVANVGDSRTYLYREGEGLRKVTHDHSVVASLVEAGIIKPDDIYTHPKRNQIYRSLGEKSVVEVDSFVLRLQAGDKLLLCSDGLWDMVRDPKIEEVIKNPVPDPLMTADALIQAALDGGGEDNVTVIVVSLNEGSDQTLISGIQLLAKPETLQMPQI